MGFATLPAMPRLLGYARVSTAEQNLDLQRDALERAGCERIFADTASGALDDRPQLAKAMGALRAGDALVVWRLDRLGRSLRHLIETVNDLRDRRIGFRSLQEAIDTSSSGASSSSTSSGPWRSSSGSWSVSGPRPDSPRPGPVGVLDHPNLSGIARKRRALRLPSTGPARNPELSAPGHTNH